MTFFWCVTVQITASSYLSQSFVLHYVHGMEKGGGAGVKRENKQDEKFLKRGRKKKKHDSTRKKNPVSNQVRFFPLSHLFKHLEKKKQKKKARPET